MTFTLGTDGGAMRPGVDSDETLSRLRLCLLFNKGPWCASRSTPTMGTCTSGITKGHVKSRRSPSFRLRAVYTTWGWWSLWRRIGCSLCAPCVRAGVYVGRRTGRTPCPPGIAV